MTKVRHVLGISGGKDSAALAMYLADRHPELNIEYYFCDTGKEMEETYQVLENLESHLGKKIERLVSEEAHNSNNNPFDYFYKAYNGYLPSSVARWCTKQMKLEPFEKYVGTDPVVSYVGIRGDEDREGYISKKPNIQSIFPFRRNIWSEDVVQKVLANSNREHLKEIYVGLSSGGELDRMVRIIDETLMLDPKNPQQNKRAFSDKLNALLDRDVILFNHAVFRWLKSTSYPLALEEDFPLLNNDEVLVRDDIFALLENSVVGVPQYYKKVEFEVDGQKGEYARSRSGCYFCFFQQKIEWVWLYEQHPALFEQARAYENEKEGFTWNPDESLADLIRPARLEQIKKEHLKRLGREKSKGSEFLLDILDDTEAVGCTACFI